VKFAAEGWFLALVLVPALAGFFAWTSARRRRALLRFADARLLPLLRPAASDWRRRAKAAMVLAAVAFLIVSLARPQFGTTTEEVRRKGIDLVIAVDVSRSMLAQDVRPNRLGLARQEIAGLVDRLKGDRVGLVAFAGEAYLLCPLTVDYGAVQMFLDILDTDLVPTPGTNLPAAIAAARAAFEVTERKHKVLLLLTDGEGHEGDAVKASEEARAEGVRIYTVGVGTPRGEFIPELDAEGKVTGYQKDGSGELVRSALDETTLQKIALVADGKYHPASYEERELTAIADDLGGMEKKDLKSQMIVRYKDRYQWVLALAVALLIAEPLVSERRRAKSARGEGGR
jgi:Ca-activated chloride channel family protein